ncbi:tetratricopeptide repeat-containing sulfotransferase family protein [Paludibacterium denitrificans]|uniref:tetratricopeptide repeat-containing sulfotransferase family protein n=1 Tax=Paludibacterium denitrificans TaxID=2675226 RepID=UPI001E5D158F|nr:sulfotransferase [Paludibacterium denitrificans]
MAEEAMIARAVLFMESGNKEDAIVAFDRALQRFPGSVRVMAARSDSKTYCDEDPDIAAMETALLQAVKPPLNEQMSMHFALGKAYLDTHNSERAFFHLHKGNAIKRATFSYDSAQTLGWMRRIAEAFTPALIDRFKAAGAASTRPVFIIGMPRSGTTLLEQILASHPGIHGAGGIKRFAACNRPGRRCARWPGAMDCRRLCKDRPRLFIARGGDCARGTAYRGQDASQLCVCRIDSVDSAGARIIHVS